MKYKLLIANVLLFISVLSSAQIGHKEDDIVSLLQKQPHTIMQKAGSNETLIKYLGIYAQSRKELFVLLFSPQMCPRCEADIPYIFKHLKEIKPDADLALIAVNEQGELTRKYVKEHFGDVPLIVDTQNRHEKIFHYGAGRLAVTFLLQIDCEQGRMMIGGDMPTLDNDILRSFCHNTAYMPYFETENCGEDGMPLTNHLLERYKVMPVTTPKSDIQLDMDKGYPLSDVCGLPAWHGSRFAYCDHLLSQAILYEIDEIQGHARMAKVIKPTCGQERRYSRIPAAAYEEMQKQGQLFIMSNCCAFVPHGEEAVVSYSLPDLTMEKDNGIAYYNKPALLFERNHSDSCMLYTYDAGHDARPFYMYLHAVHIMPLSLREMMLGCKKLGDIDIRQSASPAAESFEDDFYQDTPMLAIFDLESGKLVRRLGRIGDACRATRTGYFFVVPKADVYRGDIVYTDGCSGEVYLCDFATDCIKRKLSLFDVEIPEGLMRKAESLKGTYEYYDKFFDVFRHSVEDVKLDRKGIHCLIRVGSGAEATPDDLYVYRLFNCQGREILHLRLGTDASDTLRVYGLGKDASGEVFPFALCKNGKGCFLRRF